MTIALIITAHGRPRLTKFVMDYYAGLRLGDLRLSLFCACSSLADVSERAHRWVRPNVSLSRRWNEVCERTRPYVPDAVVVVGSDDLISRRGLIFTAQKLKDHPIVIPERCHVYDTDTGRLAYLTGVGHVGCGRAFRRDVLERFDYRLWQDDPQDIVLKDGEALPRYAWMPVAAQMQRMGDALNAAYAYDPRTEGVAICDMKTPEGNIWSYDTLLGKTEHEEEEAEAYFREHFPGVADELLNWSEVLA